MSDHVPPENDEQQTSQQMGAAPDGGMPRWVKISVVVAGLLIATFLVLRLTGAGGEHGPGRHMGPEGDRETPGVTEHRPPTGVPDHG